MTDREIFEKETGIKLKPAAGSGLLWQEYAEWLEKRSEWVSVEDRLPGVNDKIIFTYDNDIWSTVWREKYDSVYTETVYAINFYGSSKEISKSSIKEYRLITPPDEAKRGRG